MIPVTCGQPETHAGAHDPNRTPQSAITQGTPSEAKRGSEVGCGGSVVPRCGPGDAIQPAGQSGVRQRGADHHAVECRVDHHGMDRLICSDTLVEGDDDGESARLVVGTTDDFRQPCLRASAVPREQS